MKQRMPYPPEYEEAGRVFTKFLVEVKQEADFGSSHMAYAILDVARALRRFVRPEPFDRLLGFLSPEAAEFWRI